MLRGSPDAFAAGVCARGYVALAGIV
jgi:hypothetical protein